MLPILTMQLDTTNVATGDVKKLEDASRIIYEVQESFFNFIGPRDDRKKFTALFGKLAEHGIYDMVLEHVRLYAMAKNKDAKVDGDMQIDSVPGDAAGNKGGAPSTVSNQFMLNVFRMLENASRFSLQVNSRLLGDADFVKDLGTFLPAETQEDESAGRSTQYNPEDYPFVNEVIAVLHALLSDKPPAGQKNTDSKDQEKKKEDDKPDEKDKKDGDNNEEPPKPEPSPHQKMLAREQAFEAEKRAMQLDGSYTAAIQLLADSILPRLFFVYEATVNSNQRAKILMLIDKTLSLFDEKLLKTCIKSGKAFAHFSYQILKTRHVPSINTCLQMTRTMLNSDKHRFAVPMIREGVVSLVRDLSKEDSFKRSLGLRPEISITEDGFDLEVHTLRETINYLRIYSPEDSVKIQACSQRLNDLIERQRQQKDDAKRGV